MAVHRLSRTEARRIAVGAQLLTAERPTDLVDLVRQLTFLQLDPTAAIAPSADLVAWSRLGGDYRPEQLRTALDVDRSLVEFDAMVRPMTEIGLQLAGAEDWPPWQRARDWISANDSFRRDLLDRLRSSGPLMSRDLPDTAKVSWGSTGWTNNRNVTQMLEFLVMKGEVAVAGRDGKQRVWDLAERIYPTGLTIPSQAEATKINNERRLRALGIARAKAQQMPMEPIDVGKAGEPAVVDGVRGEWRVDPEALDRAFEGRTALLSPFDRLVHDRKRAQELFDFEYTLEMYKPSAKRRWGYFALPILHQDRLVGKLGRQGGS